MIESYLKLIFMGWEILIISNLDQTKYDVLKNIKPIEIYYNLLILK